MKIPNGPAAVKAVLSPCSPLRVLRGKARERSPAQSEDLPPWKRTTSASDGAYANNRFSLDVRAEIRRIRLFQLAAEGAVFILRRSSS